MSNVYMYNQYQNPYYYNNPLSNLNYQYQMPMYPNYYPRPIYNTYGYRQIFELKDYGNAPFVIDIEKATVQNDNFRTTLWTGDNLQLTLMSINVGEDIGLEIHPNHDQFIRIEAGQGLVLMGDRKDQLTFRRNVADDFSIIIPAGKWHNLINTGDEPLKLYSIYAPVEHPYGTTHKSKAEADQSHHT